VSVHELACFVGNANGQGILVESDSDDRGAPSRSSPVLRSPSSEVGTSPLAPSSIAARSCSANRGFPCASSTVRRSPPGVRRP